MNKENLQGKEYWRSLDQLADTPEFRKYLENEFPEGIGEDNSLSRRNFIALMGASMALGGLLGGCRRPVEKIIPYVTPPEEIIPGVANRYATTMPFGNSAYGLIVESHEGRPTKIEGNPDHPSTMGMSNVFLQASILGLYDPDRSKAVLHDGQEAEWSEFVEFWNGQYEKLSKNKGDGLAILSESFSSPTLARLAGQFKRKFPKAKWVAYEPVGDENIFEGVRIASGQALRPVYHYNKAKVVLSLDSDFLYDESENITSAKGYADGRRLKSEKDDMNRLYMVESGFSVTGGMADHRIRLRSRLIGSLTAALIRELDSSGLNAGGILPDINFIAAPELDRKWIKVVARDLINNKRRCLVVAGHDQPAGVHAMVYAINHALGNIGNTVEYYSMNDSLTSNRAEFASLTNDMNEGHVDTLVVLGGNPVYNAYSDLGFNSAMKKVENTIHLSSHVDETSKEANWHIPQAHYLESWGDVVSVHGIKSVVQPMIAPLYDGHSAYELANLIATGEEKGGYEIVVETWGGIINGDFERSWNRVLHDGLFIDKKSSAKKTGLNSGSVKNHLKKNISSYHAVLGEDIEISFAVSPAVYDGRFANNGWLQELPDPITKLAWDNAAQISHNTANKLDVNNEDLIEIEYRGKKIEAPVWVVPGHADNAITLTLGYGRNSCGRIGDGVGYNAYLLRNSDAPAFDTGVAINKTGRIYKLASSQDHSSMEGRPIVREATLEEYRDHPEFAPGMVEHPPLKNLWDDHSYEEGYQWGMTIDLNSCIGCNACTIACQSENNIPIVGKNEFSKGREMHWIRLDRYFTGDVENPEMVHQPIACQHCENAPCEQVCPVAATVHDKEGLNTMVYNRCVGTRYCSNNCPYKVRRFNYLNFTKDTPESMKMAQNPDVTVRSRGVMEKCTYCVQRISEAKIKSKADGRDIVDGEIVTACQQSCLTNAIVFGNINDPESEVSKIKSRNRNYELLKELNVRPRTSFLARVRNLNPELDDSKKETSN
ncbi:MAG: TAT-variant-translocated molybdopterin oxidoreductase [candidate division Zixibacteria bacterium]